MQLPSNWLFSVFASLGVISASAVSGHLFAAERPPSGSDEPVWSENVQAALSRLDQQTAAEDSRDVLDAVRSNLSATLALYQLSGGRSPWRADREPHRNEDANFETRHHFAEPHERTILQRGRVERRSMDSGDTQRSQAGRNEAMAHPRLVQALRSQQQQIDRLERQTAELKRSLERLKDIRGSSISEGETNRRLVQRQRGTRQTTSVSGEKFVVRHAFRQLRQTQ